MLYNLLLPHVNDSNIANLFHYITFRSVVAMLSSLILCFMIAPRSINYLRSLQKYGQPIRDDGPQSHKAKVGTPTMGGIIIIITTIIPTLLLVDLTNPYIWITMFVFIGLGIVGFVDDYAKVTKNNHYGISGKKKLMIQCLLSLIACILIELVIPSEYNNKLALPFCKNLLINLGIFYLPFTMFVISGASNAVNLTDGLDGLAIVPVAICAGSFGIIAYLTGNHIYSHYLHLVYIPHVGELSILCSSIVGSSLGFLWFNSQPAEIFMGDIGSLSLGGVLGVISVITKHEIILAIIGGLFVIEALSVIIQVYYFKLTSGKRIFRMAPIHHHFEKLGWPESKVVIRFWIVAIIFALIGLSSLKLR
jgi:phospho-N-acetylmuramoyl-pentapeptide-transferase